MTSKSDESRSQEPAAEPEATGLQFRDDQYRRVQLLEQAPTLVGAPRFVLETAFKLYAKDEDEVFTVAEAQKLVEKLKNYQVEVA